MSNMLISWGGDYSFWEVWKLWAMIFYFFFANNDIININKGVLIAMEGKNVKYILIGRTILSGEWKWNNAIKSILLVLKKLSK